MLILAFFIIDWNCKKKNYRKITVIKCLSTFELYHNLRLYGNCTIDMHIISSAGVVFRNVLSIIAPNMLESLRALKKTANHTKCP